MIDEFKIFWEVLNPAIRAWMSKLIPIEYFLSFSGSQAGVEIQLTKTCACEKMCVTMDSTNRHFLICVMKREDKPRIIVFSGKNDQVALYGRTFVVSNSTLRDILDGYYVKTRELSIKRRMNIDENQLDLQKNKKIKITK